MQLNCYLIEIENESAESNRRRLHELIIATPRDVTAIGAERVQPVSKDAPAHDTFTRLLQRLEPDAEALWEEAKTQIDSESGILVLDDSTLEKPYSEFKPLVTGSGRASKKKLSMELI